MSTYDVIILGSGIAGATMGAILARHGKKTLIVDSAVHPRFAVGESTAPHATMLMRIVSARYQLPELGYCTFFHTLRRHVTTACGIKRNFGFVYHREGEEQREGELVESIFSDLPYGSEHHFFRQDIDAYLFQTAVRYGAHSRQAARVTDVDLRDDGVAVTLGDGERHEAAYLIDATGHRSLVADKLGLREEPTRMRTHSRCLFNHFVDVKPYEECRRAPGADRCPNPFSQGTLHHLFEGGWLWVIPFNNHPAATNQLVSVGLSLDPRRYPKPSGSPDDEFARFIERFPSIAEQFEGARPVRNWVSTDRLQYSVKQTIGRRYALMAHASGFIDALYSRGMVNTMAVINTLAGRLLEALDDGDFSDARFAYVDRFQQSLHDANDRLVHCSYVSWCHFPLWTAWYRVWATGSLLGGMRLNRALCRFLETGDASFLELETDVEHPGLLCPDYPPYIELLERAAADVEAVAAHTLAPEQAAANIERYLDQTPFAGPILASGLFRYQPARWAPASNYNLSALMRLVRWARHQAPAHIRERYFDYRTTTLLRASARFLMRQDPLAVAR